MKQVILTHTQIDQKINRLAFQLIENTFELDTIYIGGKYFGTENRIV
jgi:hypothetical protein